MAKLRFEHGSASLEVRKAAAIGSFLFSEKAASTLAQLRDDLDDPHHNQDVVEEMSADLDSVRKAIRELPNLARRDLGLKLVQPNKALQQTPQTR